MASYGGDEWRDGGDFSFALGLFFQIRRRAEKKCLMAKAKIFLWLGLSFIAGIALRSWLNINNFPAYLAFLVCLAWLIIFWQNRKIRLVGLGGIFLFLGILRFNLNLPVIDDRHIAFYHNRPLNFVGVIKKEPDQRLNQVKLTIGDINILGQAIEGQVLISANLYPAYQYGDRLKINCALTAPGKIEDFDYDRYLARYDIYSVCYYPKIELIAQRQGSKFYQAILKIKGELQTVINQTLPEPQAALLSGIILGERGNITAEWQQRFARAGISHIIAISGMNITIIAGLLVNLMLLLAIGRRKGFYLAVLVLIVFIILIGAPASAVRAGIMGILLLLAQQTGRLGQPLNILVFTAGVMLAINPLLLKSDVGWQLSFLAVLGILYFKPFLEKIKSEKRDNWQIRESLEMTLAAQFITLPLLVFNFGQWSLIAPLANLLILPVLPLLTMAGLLAPLLGLLWLPLAKILFWPIWLVLSYILKVVAIADALPFAAWQIKFPWWLVGLAYIIIFFWLWRENRRL
ncbi:MAG: ComEC/Rec2 family competence protein [bacterium]